MYWGRTPDCPAIYEYAHIDDWLITLRATVIHTAFEKLDDVNTRLEISEEALLQDIEPDDRDDVRAFLGALGLELSAQTILTYEHIGRLRFLDNVSVIMDRQIANHCILHDALNRCPIDLNIPDTILDD